MIEPIEKPEPVQEEYEAWLEQNAPSSCTGALPCSVCLTMEQWEGMQPCYKVSCPLHPTDQCKRPCALYDEWLALNPEKKPND